MLVFATAGHVVRNAHAWGQRITLYNDAFQKPLVLHADDRRFLHLHESMDSALVGGRIPKGIGEAFPKEPIKLLPAAKFVKPGVEVGWLGYPAFVPSNSPCFFSGHISEYINRRYFIDGVAIGGVSGGLRSA